MELVELELVEVLVEPVAASEEDGGGVAGAAGAEDAEIAGATDVGEEVAVSEADKEEEVAVSAADVEVAVVANAVGEAVAVGPPALSCACRARTMSASSRICTSLDSRDMLMLACNICRARKPIARGFETVVDLAPLIRTAALPLGEIRRDLGADALLKRLIRGVELLVDIVLNCFALTEI